jgi:C1A family cysteine protease
MSMSPVSTTGPLGYETIGRSYDAFKQSLLVEPVNISFAVGNDFSFYSSGIYTGAGCASQINHAMQAVGYGVSNGEEYFIIRNSWGTTWGMGGYANVKAISGSYGVCGLYDDNTFTLVGYDPLGSLSS